MQVAEAFKDDEAIYFPHNLDFRGRAYPMHPHLQHLGNDLCRGLLEFAQGKPLGQEGLGWLFVQVRRPPYVAAATALCRAKCLYCLPHFSYLYKYLCTPAPQPDMICT